VVESLFAEFVDEAGEFEEFVGGGVDAGKYEFVVTAPQVLDEAMTADHRRRSPIRS
jgi:hypothetical protein